MALSPLRFNQFSHRPSNGGWDVAASDEFEYFLNLDTATFPSLTEVEKNINPHTIASLNEALSGDIIIVEKDINELTDALYGRKF